MPFTPPKPEDLKGYSKAGIDDLRNHAETELTALRASVTPDTVTDEQLEQMEGLKSFIAAADTEVQERDKRAERFNATDVPPRPEPEVEPVTAASEPDFDSNGDKNVTDTTVTSAVANASTEVVDATITAAGASNSGGRRSVQVADVAPHAPAVDIPEGGDTPGFTIIAAADIANVPTGATLDWLGVGKAFEERVRAYPGIAKMGGRTRMQHPLVQIRRDFPESQVLMEGDDHRQAFAKLRNAADAYNRGSLVAANGFCTPSEPDYSICSPISADGLINLPEEVLRRGGKIHNQGLDFADFFGNDFTLPIPGYNILTEAQVIADTAKTCVEIPCPDFVDDRLNVAALCLTSSLLQNRGYPEFVAEFTRGAIAAMAHLVNREVINEIATGSTAVVLTAVDPWGTDNTFLSNLLSAVEFAVKDMRYIYRAPMSQRFDVVLPYWSLAAMRADYIRRNAAANDDIADSTIQAMFAVRGANVQWVYDWQDAFNAAPGTIPATNQLGNATPPFNYPTFTSFLIYLPGTWILGRQDVIRLDTVYDSTNLQQNLVTQLFMEDGFRPMRMCQHSRLYTVPTCASGATGVQRAVACADVTP